MDNYRRELEDLIMKATEQGASDLHLAVGHYPTLRVEGKLVPLTTKNILNAETVQQLVFSILNESQGERLKKERDLDLAFSFKERVRLRINIFYQKSYLGAAFRLVPLKIKTIEELNLPKNLHRLNRARRGLVVVAGPTGHGTSTTLAALVDDINKRESRHIVTIEDPIEYIFTPEKSIIDQREVGRDTMSFAKALRSSFRQDADVIMLGQIRDKETMSTALNAAGTGHLVFATLHTSSATQTINRIIGSFPPDQQGQIRVQLAAVLLGIVSQRLVPRSGGGLIPAVEVLIANYAIRNLIREKKIHQINLVLETGVEDGMISLDKYLAGLVRQGYISLENAELYSSDPNELATLLNR